ncbi:GTP-binding protein [Leptolyngbya sp. AN02str]|uniref:GTP-binding protein n=1 Tax=Leptolyngbya sp. AN02str TaxID=3423363 RepID=UPI003D31248C
MANPASSEMNRPEAARPDVTRAVGGTGGIIPLGMQDIHYQRARTSLKQVVNRYRQLLRSPRQSNGIELQAALKTELNQVSSALDKLNANLVRVAVFGLVSRGKSAVVNALIGQKVLPTGPINGVTQYPRSVYWSLDLGEPITVELIDTPGLDEVGGQSRAAMALDVAHAADLILFVVAGDITRTEYHALSELQAEHKPILVVFNKMDLYPDRDRQAIYHKLQELFANGGTQTRPFFKPEDIVMVAAEPSPLQVRVEWEDGRITHEWESPPAQIDELKRSLMAILSQEGKSLLALNALRQAREAEQSIARKSIKLQQAEAEDLIWQFAKWKAAAIALNPIPVLDLLGGFATDVVMIRMLAKLYGLPMTRYEATKLVNAIVWSSGSLLFGELGSGLLLGVGKGASAIASAFDTVSGFMAYSSAAIAQATLAGYGSYRVGKAAQVYLEQGCTWGPDGINTTIQDILAQVDEETVLYRLRREISAKS